MHSIYRLSMGCSRHDFCPRRGAALTSSRGSRHRFQTEHTFLPGNNPQLIVPLPFRSLLRQQQLWYAYLQERYEAVRDLRITEAAYPALNNTFERALVTMHKMPKIWELYLNFLVEQQDVTSVRQTCNRALASLPVTQHDRVWTIYLVSTP